MDKNLKQYNLDSAIQGVPEELVAVIRQSEQLWELEKVEFVPSISSGKKYIRICLLREVYVR